MSERENKYIEKLIDSVMKDAPIERPSFDFTSTIMSKVESLSKSQTTVYQPLISKTVWGFLLVSAICLILFFAFGQPQSESWFTFDYSSLNLKVSQIIGGINPSNATFYGLLFLAIMLLVQIPILKRYFDSRLEF